ncbi:M20 family metallopeptidase [Auritidibacter ignavus]|uniref:M20 family metallopeptidase n=1 Tax=Auritidibacter ignavus TaxID=678932 RepID=UPI0024488AC9|nr:M20 family metallopeptidase [Auritidibacter ignavus]WGH86785.1 M20 family metallopeptidase [Auritidibacter ignavus]WGH89071.1 M20 family metallopeptidase [Auritidibacter ignavus]
MPATTDAVENYINSHQQEFIDDLRRVVTAETPSNDKALLDSGLEVIRHTVISRTGEPDAEFRNPHTDYGDVLKLHWHGRTAEDHTDSIQQAVLVLCHYDTVWPQGTIDDWPLKADGDKLSGPGVLDMKFGIIQLAWAIRAMKALGQAFPPVTLLLTGDEEIGSLSSRHLIEDVASRSRLTLVTEPSAQGHPKHERKGVMFADVRVYGRQSHAGLEPEKGANAIHALATIISDITSLADPEQGTTVNVGVINGGTGRNVVAGFAEALVDIRVTTLEEQQRINRQLPALKLPEPFASDDRLSLEIEMGAGDRPPMTLNPASERALYRALEVGKRLGRELSPKAAGGASDANFVAARGLAVIDGLGADGEGPHAFHEHILISSIAPQTALLAGIIQGLG